MRDRTRRYPLADLLEVAHLTWEGLLDRLEAKGIDSNILYDAQAHGGLLTEHTAERLAIACRFVPYVVWPEWIVYVIEDCSKPCAQCAQLFVPKDSRVRYCSQRCYDLGAQRRSTAWRRTPRGREVTARMERERYHSDPEYRASKIASAERARRRAMEDPERLERRRRSNREAQRRLTARKRAEREAATS